MYTCGHTVTGN